MTSQVRDELKFAIFPCQGFHLWESSRKKNTLVVRTYHSGPDYWLAQFSQTKVHKCGIKHLHFHFPIGNYQRKFDEFMLIDELS